MVAQTLRGSLEQVVLPQYKTCAMNKTRVGKISKMVRPGGGRGDEGREERLTQVVVFQEAWKV